MDAKKTKAVNNRTVYLEQLHRVELFMRDKGENATLPELELRFQTLDKIFSNLASAQANLEAIDPEEIKTATRAQFEELYYTIRPALQVLITKFNQSNKLLNISHTESTKPSIIRLPKVEIKTFTGDITKWLEFYESFNTMVHENDNLNDVTRFQYLRNALSGSAARVIDSLELTAHNYHEAIKLLVDRYNNKKLICLEHIRALLSLKYICKPTSDALREIMDNTNSHLRALASLGCPTIQWNDLVVQLIYSKLDPDTRSKWDDESPPDRLSTLEEFFKFITRRCHTIDGNASTAPKPTFTRSKNRAYTNQSTYHTSSSNFKTFRCLFCTKEGHMIYRCTKFLNLPIDQRIQEVNRIKLCANCLKSDHLKEKCLSKHRCFNCKQIHHSLLHQESHNVQDSNLNTSTLLTTSQNGPQSTSESIQSTLSTVQTCNNASKSSMIVSSSYIFIATAIVQILDQTGSPVLCRALLDSASQLNFITKSLAAQLGLHFRKTNVQISGIGHARVSSNFDTSVTIKSRFNSFTAELDVCILPKITERQPSMEIDCTKWNIPKNLKLADPCFHSPQKIDLLIGAELFFKLITQGQIMLDINFPHLQNTHLGWIISGKVSTQNESVHKFNSVCNIAMNSDDSKIESIVENFWKIENIPYENTKLSIEEAQCETHFQQNFFRDKSGRFVVSLPLHTPANTLGNSREMAIRRFIALEKRLIKDQSLYKQYSDFIHEYRELKHMQLIQETDIEQNHYFMPHHCVIKPESSSTKLRVVFDASAKTSSGKSLNDILMIGPVLQEELFSILLRFRTHKFVLSADIVKMYRQINISEKDSHLQLIVWRDSPKDKLQFYKLNTITYGTASAPYLATKCIQVLCEQEKQKYQFASEILKRDTYIDDILTGTNTVKELIQLKEEIIHILNTAGMELKKWCSNNQELLLKIPESNHEKLFTLDNCDTAKTLGMYWQPQHDQFRFDVKINFRQQEITKRTILSDISRIFDPLGLIGPVIILAKIFIQKLWLLQQDWDAKLPVNLQEKWIEFRRDLPLLNTFRIDRYLFLNTIDSAIEIHGFADASEKAYGASVYVRRSTSDGSFITKLVCAKSRVAPIKSTTLPRLELCAAQLLAELVHRVIPILHLKIDKIFYWSDSKIVLAWIKQHSSTWQTFVANRVSTIQELSSNGRWYHVSSTNNPADIISRGTTPAEFIKSTIWINGPPFLSSAESSWPVNTSTDFSDELPEKRNQKLVLHSTEENDDILENIKYKLNFKSLRNIMSYVKRFIDNIKLPKNKRRIGRLRVEEQVGGLNLILKLVQNVAFFKEISLLKCSKPIDSKNHLNSLSIFLDESGLLRVGGRLHNSNLPFTEKHPILLPGNHFFTNVLLTHLHNKHLHVGPQALLAIVRQLYWPIQGKRLCQNIFRSCIRCFKVNPKSIHQKMGNLPAVRVNSAPPFTNVGIDYCGPFYVHYKVRGKSPTKSYVAVFICLAVKAIHLELVTELTTAAFIGALKRFVSTRGLCKNIYSDNATNFVGARAELKNLLFLFNSQNHNDEISNFCKEDNISWHFSPPGSPHFGGIYEAAVKSAKFHMVRILGNASLTFEELNTVIKQIEAILNSRPLTTLPSSPDDSTALTPGHFLVGRPLTSLVEPSFEDEAISTTKRWRNVQILHQHFWSRWSAEYLRELQKRQKWKTECPNISIGEIVLIMDDNLPPLKWRLGRVIELHTGSDGNTRVVTIKTMQGIFKRAVTKICPLPKGT